MESISSYESNSLILGGERGGGMLGKGRERGGRGEGEGRERGGRGEGEGRERGGRGEGEYRGSVSRGRGRGRGRREEGRGLRGRERSDRRKKRENQQTYTITKILIKRIDWRDNRGNRITTLPIRVIRFHIGRETREASNTIFEDYHFDTLLLPSCINEHFVHVSA